MKLSLSHSLKRIRYSIRYSICYNICCLKSFGLVYVALIVSNPPASDKLPQGKIGRARMFHLRNTLCRTDSTGLSKKQVNTNRRVKFSFSKVLSFSLQEKGFSKDCTVDWKAGRNAKKKKKKKT